MGATILIVEDNDSNMKLFRDVLAAHGHETVGTRDGAGAMEIINEVEPDLVVMDIQLPDVSGLEVTRWIREHDRLSATPVVAVTAFAMKGDAERIMNAGCDAYLAKPITIDEFMSVVQKFLDMRQAG